MKLYHRKSDEISSRLQQVIPGCNYINSKIRRCYFVFPEYQLLRRVLLEQAETDSKGNVIPKDKNSITPSSLQNPSDQMLPIETKQVKRIKGMLEIW